MAKIKLTEAQIKMLQSLDETPKKRVVKITTEQYNRIFESELKLPSQSNMASSQVTKHFKNNVKNIPNEKIKVEGEVELLGHPIGGTGGDEYNPQTEPDNEKTFSSFNEAIANTPIDIVDFSKEVVSFLKELLIDPSDETIGSFWKEIGISRDELVAKMFDINMLSHGLVNDRKIIKVLKDGFIDKMKTLYGELIPQMDEGLLQMGDDIEVQENDDNDKVRKAFTNPLEKKQGQARSPEMIKAKLAALRAQELDRRNQEDERPIGEEEGDNTSNQVVGLDILNVFPFSQLAQSRKDVNWQDRSVEGWGPVYLPSVDDSDSQTQIFSKDDIIGYEFQGPKMLHKYAGYVGEFKQKFGEEPIFSLHPEEPWFGKVKIINPKYNEWKEGGLKAKGDWLRNAGTTENLEIETETTSAASSGSFVAPMGSKVIDRPLSPEDAMKELEEEDKAPKMQTVTLTQGEIQNAMKQNVHRNKKKFYRPKKHKGKLDEYDLENEVDLSTLKYRNFTHPSLGTFYVNDIKDKKDDESKLSYVITLKKDGGKPSDSCLIYTFNKQTGEEKVTFNHKFEKLYNAYKLFDEIYALVFDGIKDTLKPNDIEETTTAASSGSYVQPKIWAKDKENMRFGKQTMYPKGKIVDKTMNESDNQTKTAYPDGGFVEFDDCTKLNNNKEAINGGCSTGAIDNVVKVKKSKGSVISDDALYYEVAKRTGKTIDEVKNIITSRKS
jgi:Zn-finger nucleic acid-binding protein